MVEIGVGSAGGGEGNRAISKAAIGHRNSVVVGVACGGGGGNRAISKAAIGHRICALEEDSPVEEEEIEQSPRLQLVIVIMLLLELPVVDEMVTVPPMAMLLTSMR